MITKYLPSDGLLQSLKVAEKLNRPLLLTGEPGTGKTKFADFILSFDQPENYSELEKFYTKSLSLSQDLFYDFDSIGYFASKQLNEKKPITAFIYLKSLGKAICNALGKESVENILKESKYFNLLLNSEKVPFVEHFLAQINEKPVKSIVLIDEIDKAPRDFPNDILNEIDESYKFIIKEIDIEFELLQKNMILIIITSNFEKNLPEPFLRRCIFYNIEFPSESELLKIICLKLYPDFLNEIVNNLTISEAIEKSDIEELKLIWMRLNEIVAARNLPSILKKPSTAEILDFFECLKYDKDDKLKTVIDRKHPYISTLIKRKEDLPKV